MDGGKGGSLSSAGRDMVRWMRVHGSDCAVAKSPKGGAFFLAQGETAPFTMGTARQLVDAGVAEYVAVGSAKRLRLTDAAKVVK